jgi:hypothetical protein
MSADLRKQECRLSLFNALLIHIDKRLLQIQVVYYINDFAMKSYTPFRGPSLILLAIVHVVIFVSNLVVVAALRHGAPYVNPFAPAEVLSAFFLQNPAAVRIGSLLLFGSAVPFGIFAVTLVSRLRFLGIRAVGTNIALLGGVVATIALVLSGILGWILSLTEIAVQAPLAKAVFFLSFLFGGVTYAVGFGLLAAGVSVTSYFNRILPRWLVVLGMVVALAGEFSSLSLVSYPANYLIPISRYAGFIWMLAVAISLTRNQRKVQITEDGNIASSHASTKLAGTA